MYEALKDFSHPTTGFLVKKGKKIHLTCGLTITMLINMGAIRKL